MWPLMLAGLRAFPRSMRCSAMVPPNEAQPMFQIPIP
jgi:hypothetical protein